MATMTLRALLEGMAVVDHEHDCSIFGLSDDSRTVTKGQVFFAYPGSDYDGRNYIEAAISAGAAAVIYDNDNFDELTFSSPVPMVAIEALQSKLGSIAARFFRTPSHDMNVYAVTGTNGKTSVSHFLAQALSGVRSVGVMGTLGNGLWGQLADSSLTTPSALSVQKMLMQMRADGVKDVVMEASSHGLDQKRLSAVHVNTAIFTNLTQDHLDYHKTMDSYAAAKQSLFETDGIKNVVVNVYDAFGAELAKRLSANIALYSYGLDGEHGDSAETPMIRGVIRKSDISGLEIDIESVYGSATLISKVMGRFNAENLLAALAAMLANDIEFIEALEMLSQVQAVRGRMERFGEPNQTQVFVDYAHTPAALEAALSELRAGCRGRLYLVFGCGGDRDVDKRAQMGAVAEKYADVIVITDDNPRHESGEEIIENILSGISADKDVHIERDRAKAIFYGLEQASQEDVVLVAGKGHEEYQLVGDQKIAFSDRDCIGQFMVRAA